MPSNEKEPEAIRPGNRNARIWRYMDLAKYLYFITHRSLFFVRADKLDDPFEGSFPKPDYQERQEYMNNLKLGDKPVPPELVEKMKADDAQNRRNEQKDNFISCWCVDEDESMAMWEIYGGKGKSIAIQSTYEKLHQALPNDAFLSMVQYIDFENASIFAGKQYGASPFDFKRNAFSFEKELRGLIGRWKPGVVDPNRQYDENEWGMGVPVDPSALVEKVVVSPKTPQWVFRLVQELTKRSGLNFPVTKSTLDVSPIF